MPSGWGTYYLVVLSAVFALGIPIALRAISSLFSSKGGGRKEETLAHSDTTLGKSINTRFFLGANIALALISFTLLLIPVMSALGAGALGIIAVLTLGTFISVALLYSARKGDLSWLETFRAESRRE